VVREVAQVEPVVREVAEVGEAGEVEEEKSKTRKKMNNHKKIFFVTKVRNPLNLSYYIFFYFKLKINSINV
jgi:hypothetical protein